MVFLFSKQQKLCFPWVLHLEPSAASDFYKPCLGLTTQRVLVDTAGCAKPMSRMQNASWFVLPTHAFSEKRKLQENKIFDKHDIIESSHEVEWCRLWPRMSAYWSVEALGLDHGRQKLYGKVLYPTNSDPQEALESWEQAAPPSWDGSRLPCPGSLSTKTNSEVELDHRSGPHHAAAIRPLRPPKFPPKRNVTSVCSGGSPALSGADSTIAIAKWGPWVSSNLRLGNLWSKDVKSWLNCRPPTGTCCCPASTLSWTTLTKEVRCSSDHDIDLKIAT